MAQPAIRHSGMLTMKIQRHDANWEKMPPSAGPTTDDTAQTLAM